MKNTFYNINNCANNTSRLYYDNSSFSSRNQAVCKNIKLCACEEKVNTVIDFDANSCSPPREVHSNIDWMQTQDLLFLILFFALFLSSFGFAPLYCLA